MVVRWIVCHAHGIHIHFLNQLHIVDADLFARRTTGFRMKGVPVDTLEFDFHPVDIYTVPFLNLYRPETKLLYQFVYFFPFSPRRNMCLITAGKFSRPLCRIGKLTVQLGLMAFKTG